MRVVACAPVPNAWPGSITRSTAPGLAAACSQGGRTQIRPPTSTAPWNRFQRSAQSSGTSRPLTVTSTPPTLGGPSGKRGQLARRAVDRVLHAVLEVHLLDPRGRQLEQLGQHGLGGGGGGSDRQADHPSTIDSPAMTDGGLILVAGALLALGIAGHAAGGAAAGAGPRAVPGPRHADRYDGFGLIDFGHSLHDIELARTIGVIAIVLILFEGGSPPAGRRSGR